MKYSYYPGCSLRGTGRAYEESLLAVFRALEVEVEELPDWNCCGATAYMSVSEADAFTLAARNLALAERRKRDLVAPCSGCYLVLKKCQHYAVEYPSVAARLRQSLEQSGLADNREVKVRHPLDVLVHDVGIETIQKKVKAPLRGFKVAPYYGCQIVRPFATFDDQINPTTMDKLLTALGAEVMEYPLKTRCCGGSLTGTLPEVGVRLCHILLKEAGRRQANVLATTCPLCQFNLDAYQRDIARRYEPVSMPVLYFTQLIGLALGLDAKQLGLKRHIAPVAPLLAQWKEAA